MLEYDELLKLMKTENWEQLLEEKGISVVWDDKYLILSYKFLSCDFNDPVIRACRGVILKKENNLFRIVCAPFVKFSYGREEWEKPIDWNSAKVRDKIDGCLMKAWFDGGWHLSTNNVIDAFKAHLGDERAASSFGELFELTINEKFETWAERLLDRNFTYMFELASPYNRVVILYKESKVWYLSRRNMITLKEDDSDIDGLERPKLYNLTNINDTLKVVKSMIDEEGVVVYDRDFNRIKVKSDSYLVNHGLAHNNIITFNVVIDMIMNKSIDDYLAYFGDATGYITNILKTLKLAIDKLENTWYNLIKSEADKLSPKEFALKVRDIKANDYLFYKFNGGELNAYDYVMSRSKSYIKKFILEEF